MLIFQILSGISLLEILESRSLEVKIMKNAEQLLKDLMSNEELRKKAHEELNKLRSDKSLGVYEAASKVARDLGYEVSEDEMKNLIFGIQNRKDESVTGLSDDELEQVAGGVATWEGQEEDLRDGFRWQW